MKIELPFVLENPVTIISNINGKDHIITCTYNKNGVFHSINGEPAYIDNQGYKAWFLNGLRHREDGPAYIILDNFDNIILKKWYIEDIEYTKEEYEQHPDVIAYKKLKCQL